MTEIRVAEKFHPICIASEDGSVLFTMIRQSFERNEAVILDFANVSTLGAPFMMTAVGCLYGSFDQDFIKKKLRWTGLDPVDEALLGLVKRKAIQFYSATPAQQEAMMIALSRHPDER